MVMKIIDFLKTTWYWFFTTLLLLVFFVSKGHSFSQVFYFITFLLPVVIGTAYYLNNRLIPEFLLRKKTGLFVLFSVYTIIISLYLQYLITFLALFVFSSFQMGQQSLLTLNIGNLSLILYLLVLLKVVIEIIQKLNQKEIIIQGLENKKEQIATAPSNKITIRYNRTSLSDYLKVVTEDGEIVTKEKVSKIIKRLPPNFKRTHRSFIVNTSKISSYNREFMTLGKIQIPISRTYKTAILGYLEQ
jgi:two-component system response regulator LytT